MSWLSTDLASAKRSKQWGCKRQSKSKLGVQKGFMWSVLKKVKHCWFCVNSGLTRVRDF